MRNINLRSEKFGIDRNIGSIMNLSNNELDQLFENVRKEKPVASFEETQRAFMAATIASAGGVLATKSLLKLFTFKQWIMMIGVLSAATVGTLLVTTSASPVNNEKAEFYPEVPAKEITKEESREEVSTKSEKIILKLEKLKTFTAKLEEVASVSRIQTRKITTQFGKPPVTVRAYLKDDGTYHFEYVITPETTEEQLKELQAEAKEAGFELKYESTYADAKLQKLSLHIVQKKENGQRQDIHISDIDLTESSEYKVAWNVDDKGTATTIACGESFKSEEMEELRELMESYEFEEMAEEFEEMREDYDELARELEEEFANFSFSYEFNFTEWEERLRIAEELLRDPEFVGSLAAAYEGLNEEVLEEVRESLEEARKAMEEQDEVFRRECETARKSCEEHAKRCRKGHDKLLNELESDGLIKDRSKRVKMTASKGKMKVNGQEIPKESRKKYEDLIMEYFEVDVKNKDMQWTWTHNE